MSINLVRDKKTGKSKGFAFLCYEDQRSTILAVDNLNGIKVSIFRKVKYVDIICMIYISLKLVAYQDTKGDV